MKKQNAIKQTRSFELRPASVEEAGLFYSDEGQDPTLGTVGHLRMDFGSGGKGFYHTWWPHNGDHFNTPEFKEALQEFVDAMRQSGPLKDLSAMNTYCWRNGGEISDNDRVYGFIAETEHYRFCLRCTPRPGDHQGYLYCYDLRQQELARQSRLVGRVTFASGEKQEFTDVGLYLQTIREEVPYCLYPNLEYACASGMSFFASDTKGDLARNYGAIARDCYGYQVSVVDLRNPTRSDGYNLLTLINRYMDMARKDGKDLASRAKAEKYAKILSKTVIDPTNENYAQNQYFYDAAEGVLTAVILLLAEYLPPREIDGALRERRHIVSVFKLVQALLGPSPVPGRNEFQFLMDHLPEEHKARWFSGSALTAAEQSMASVMSTVLSRLNTFLDSELEQVLCFDSALDAEAFASRPSAIFLILPEEDSTKNFMAGLMIQTLSRELFSLADKRHGKLKDRVVFFCDELGTMPAFDILPLFSAGRSRGLTLVPIIQSLAQLEKNYGKEGAEILIDNCQDTIFGGFAPQSQTAEALSKALGSRTVLSGSVTRGKHDPSQSLQMIERPLMTPDELKSLPKGSFIVAKTGTHPMRTRLRLFREWGITFGEPYQVPERAARKVYYADKEELTRAIYRAFPLPERRLPPRKNYHTERKGETP